MNLTEGQMILIWYGAGVFAVVIYHLYLNFVKKEELTIKIEDLTTLALFGIGGFLLWFVPLVHLGLAIVKNYGSIKSTVLWKNKRAKNREILFGEDDDDDKTKTYPKLQ